MVCDFSYGRLPPDQAELNMRHFADRVLPVMQRDAAFGLMNASLSAKGFDLTRNIMRLNETLAELSDDHDFQGQRGD